MDFSKHLKVAKRIAILLDSRFTLFGIKFGIDPLLDFVPGLGSIVGAITSTYVFWLAGKMNVPVSVYFRMTANILFDLILGEIPIAGIFFDVLYKSNLKNIKILEKYLGDQEIEAEPIEIH